MVRNTQVRLGSPFQNVHGGNHRGVDAYRYRAHGGSGIEL